VPADPRARLCELGDHLRDVFLGARARDRDFDMTTVAGVSPADTIYAVDAVLDDALVPWFEQHWPDVELVSEGLDEPVIVGHGAPSWTVIVDPVDGTRGLMHDKRSAWVLAAAGPRGGSLRDLVAASMTELPTSKQWASDQLSAARGDGRALGERVDVRDGRRSPLTIVPSPSVDLEHGFAQVVKFFPPGKTELAALEAELFSRLGASVVFDDEYVSSGGQMHELATGRDRFVAELRPLVAPAALACHPYDVCTALVLEEAGGVVTDPWGGVLDAPLDTTTAVAWVGYANPDLAAWIGPVLRELLQDVQPNG
jgi:fructose-1,6-bisphosphatase/inositol monophosphatase family enzyme